MSYKTITYCRGCNKRMVTMKGEQKKNYCEDCMKKYNSYKEKHPEE